MEKRNCFAPLIIFILLFKMTACSHIEMLMEPAPKKENPTPKAPKVLKPVVDSPYITKTRANTKAVSRYCEKIQKTFDKYKWGDSHCEDYTWKHVRNSKQGNPIIWYVFGKEEKNKIKTQNITVLLCGVHGDEITPIKFCFDVMEDLKHNTKLLKNSLVVIAPIVTPDSFFNPKPSRTNASGVDVNRNFPTEDWASRALYLWKNRYRKDPRRYPGKYAMSEQETIFQVNLINRYDPNKVISVHSPLTLLDYDGPDKSVRHGQKARQLLIQMSEKAHKYKVSDYPFFPGSLGNWAGNERDIPTYTLELPNSDWTKTDRYFKQFQEAIRHAITSDIRINPPSKLVDKEE